MPFGTWVKILPLTALRNGSPSCQPIALRSATLLTTGGATRRGSFTSSGVNIGLLICIGAGLRLEISVKVAILILVSVGHVGKLNRALDSATINLDQISVSGRRVVRTG